MKYDVVIYVWVAFWVAFIAFGSYDARDAVWKSVVGPLFFGLFWPVCLPLVALGNKGPAQYKINFKRIKGFLK